MFSKDVMRNSKNYFLLRVHNKIIILDIISYLMYQFTYDLLTYIWNQCFLLIYKPYNECAVHRDTHLYYYCSYIKPKCFSQFRKPVYWTLHISFINKHHSHLTTQEKQGECSHIFNKKSKIYFRWIHRCPMANTKFCF